SHSRQSRHQDDLAVAFARTLPMLTHHADLVGAADQRRHALAGPRREAVDGAVLADDRPDAGRPRNPFEGPGSESFVVEGGAGYGPGRPRNDDRVGLG